MANPFLKKWLQYIENHFIDPSSSNNIISDHTFINYNNNNISSDDYQTNITNLIYKINDKKLIDKNDQVILFITTLILLKRLSRNHLFSKNMIYKTILGLFIISEKINNDEMYDNYTWAQINELSIKEINNIEISLLFYLNYDTFIARNEFLHLAQMLYN